MNPSQFLTDPLPFDGAKIVGINVSAATYLRQDPEVKRGHKDYVMSRSELMLFRSNPQRWIRGYTFKDTAATDWGTLIDCLVTQPQAFDATFALQPETVTATKTMSCVKEGEAREGDQVPWQPLCKEAKEFNKQARAEGKQIVSARDFKDAKQALEVLKTDAYIAHMLNDALFQVMVIGNYVDKETGIIVPLKCLIDIVPSIKGRHANAIADFKTARSADPEKWNKVVDDQNYDAQAAICLDLYHSAKPKERWVFNHIIQENEFPYQQARRYMGDTYLAIGRIKVWTALQQYCKCLKEDSWPSWDDAGPMVVDGFGPIRPKDWLITQYGLVI